MVSAKAESSTREIKLAIQGFFAKQKDVSFVGVADN